MKRETSEVLRVLSQMLWIILDSVLDGASKLHGVYLQR